MTVPAMGMLWGAPLLILSTPPRQRFSTTLSLVAMRAASSIFTTAVGLILRLLMALRAMGTAPLHTKGMAMAALRLVVLTTQWMAIAPRPMAVTEQRLKGAMLLMLPTGAPPQHQQLPTTAAALLLFTTTANSEEKSYLCWNGTMCWCEKTHVTSTRDRCRRSSGGCASSHAAGGN